MRKTLSLILPVLFPSWRFFKEIAPSPRIQWGQQRGGVIAADDWREFRPRPFTMSLRQMALRLFWNPHGNDTLFAISCAERIQQSPDQHSINEIKRRILSDLQNHPFQTTTDLLQFRLVFVHRDGAGLAENVVFLSTPFPLPERSTC